ncbi:hypothetical protein M9H77_11748 [Catharanthus roseus]|uniref:Uncharacterized protein n=1 Tax=Catharanthus roseus TaxID=4058 RepID=A0ACC0BFG6_CATRO|nr:hypothetical protein M9H77_11748 [Catharanthus roseus]
MEVTLGPINRAQRKKLKLQEDNGVLLYMMEALKSKALHRKLELEILNRGLIMSTEGHRLTQSHQEGPSDSSRMNLNETLRSMQQSIEKLARDVVDLKKGKSSGTMEKRVGDNLHDFNSPHHQRLFNNMSTYGYHDMLIQHSHPIYEGAYERRQQFRDGRRGGLGGRGYHNHKKIIQGKKHGKTTLIKIMEIILMLAKHTMEVAMVINKGIKLLIKSSGSAVPKPQASTYRSWPKKEDNPKVAFKHRPKPKVEERGRLITNPTRSFNCNGVTHIAINCPTKRTLVFGEDLNCRIEKSDDDFQEGMKYVNILDEACERNRVRESRVFVKGSTTKKGWKHLKTGQKWLKMMPNSDHKRGYGQR